MSISTEADVIRRMLSEGRLTHVDVDGHIAELYRLCPNDNSTASVHRVSRVGNRIDEVVLRCPTCGEDFTTAPEAMHLR